MNLPDPSTVEDKFDFVEEDRELYSPQEVQASSNLSRGIMLFEPKGRHSYRMKHAFRTCIYNAMHGAYARGLNENSHMIVINIFANSSSAFLSSRNCKM